MKLLAALFGALVVAVPASAELAEHLSGFAVCERLLVTA